MKKLILLYLLLCTAIVKAQSPVIFTEFDLSTGATHSGPHSFREAGGKLLFVAIDTAHGQELFVSDGTDTGSHILKDIRTGKLNSNPEYLTVSNNKLFFAAWEIVYGRELWVSDGTDTGTRIVKNIYPGAGNSNPQEMVAYNGKVIFQATDSVYGTELWISDGTESGTQMLKDIYPGTDSSSPTNFIVFNGKVFFKAQDTGGVDVWVTDGTPGGTQQLPGISTGNWVYFVKVVDNKLYMQQATDSFNNELWVTDGTPAGTKLLIDIYPGNSNGIGWFHMTEHNGKVFFMSFDMVLRTMSDLYVTDGTPAGTIQLKHFTHNINREAAPYFCSYKGKLYFAATNGGRDTELWVTDGTVSGTLLVKDIKPDFIGSVPQFLTVYKNYLYFKASGVLMRTDGTDTGIVTIWPMAQTTPSGPSSEIYIYDSTMFFTASYTWRGSELWSLKDTASIIITPPTGNIKLANSKNNLIVYPNPSRGSITIATDLPVNGQPHLIGLVNIYGKVVFNGKLTSQKQVFNLQHLAAGVYTIKILSNPDTEPVQIVIQ